METKQISIFYFILFYCFLNHIITSSLASSCSFRYLWLFFRTIRSSSSSGVQAPTVVIRPRDFQHFLRAHPLQFTLPPLCKVVPVLRVGSERVVFHFVILGSHPHVKPHCSNTVFIWILNSILDIIPTEKKKQKKTSIRLLILKFLPGKSRSSPCTLRVIPLPFV